MTKGELIRQLAWFPDDTEVMIERGEWGPSRISNAKMTVVRDSGERTQTWVVYDPQIPDDEDDNPRLAVVLLD